MTTMHTRTNKPADGSASADSPAPSPMINGIDVGALRGAIEAITKDPAAGATNWRVRSRWMGGTRSDHHVDGFMIGGQYIDRPFTIRIDEPHELTGSNEFANPQEYLLSALNACMMVGYAAVAALMGIELTRLEVEIHGDIDLRGFLGIRDDVAPGYMQLEQIVRLAGNTDEAQLNRLHEIVQATSPNYFNLTHAVPTRSRLVIG